MYLPLISGQKLYKPPQFPSNASSPSVYRFFCLYHHKKFHPTKQFSVDSATFSSWQLCLSTFLPTNLSSTIYIHCHFFTSYSLNCSQFWLLLFTETHLLKVTRKEKQVIKSNALFSILTFLNALPFFLPGKCRKIGGKKSYHLLP